jgi:hypothetical protein
MHPGTGVSSKAVNGFVNDIFRAPRRRSQLPPPINSREIKTTVHRFLLSELAPKPPPSAPAPR